MDSYFQMFKTTALLSKAELDSELRLAAATAMAGNAMLVMKMKRCRAQFHPAGAYIYACISSASPKWVRVLKPHQHCLA